MGLGKRSLPSRAGGTDRHVTFPVVTVSGRHSLMLTVEGQSVSGSRVAAPPLLWPSATGPASHPSFRVPSWNGEIHTPDPPSEHLTFSPPWSALAGAAALAVYMGQTG